MKNNSVGRLSLLLLLVLLVLAVSVCTAASAESAPEEAAEIFLVHYERAVNGESPIEYYSPYVGHYYQATKSRREAARRWFEFFNN